MLQDKVVTWFIQNVIMPRTEIIDQPGFIVSTVSKKNGKTHMRDVGLSEDFFVNIEKLVVEKYGNKGKQALYSVGKKFAYIYASLSDFPQMGKAKDKEILDFCYFFVRYLAGVYASDAAENADLKSKTFKVSLKDYIVCRHNGIGLIMTDGGVAGTWAWICADPSIEAVQTRCQGRGDEHCEIISGPISELERSAKNILMQKELPIYSFDEHYQIKNQIKPLRYSKNSLKTLLDDRFFEYKKGAISYKNKRLFLDDAHMLYLLENELNNTLGEDNILFEAAFEEGKELAKLYGGKDWSKFITDLFPALGFGDIAILDHQNPKIGLIYYPWTELSSDSTYSIIRGTISGIITECSHKETLLKLSGIEDGEFLTITISI
jgi:predicted hydrocarbon binding protein